MQTDRLVTVVIPAYNHELYIADCLQSIAEQDHVRIEIVLIDDNSSDQTLSIARRVLESLSPRFERVVIRQNTTNRGAHFSLNRGLLLARGDYISFMNSDDKYGTGRISAIIEAMCRAESGFGFSAVKTIGDDGARNVSEALCYHIEFRPQYAEEIFPTLSWAFLWRQIAASTGNIFVSREIASRVGFFRDLRYCHDWDYILRCICYTEPVFVRHVEYHYRIHGTNSFKALSEVASSDTVEVLRSFFIRVAHRRVVNKLCPSEVNWPDTFHSLLDAAQVKYIYNRVSNPYQAFHRTVDPQFDAGSESFEQLLS